MAGPDKPGHSKKRRQNAFLAAFRETGNVRLACESSGVGRSTHYEWLEQDAAYAVAFGHAQQEAADLLEEEARRRAVEGVEEPVGWFQGSPGGTVLKYSDSLLMFLLKGVRPEKYRERHEVTGANGGPVAHSMTVRFVKPDGNGNG